MDVKINSISSYAKIVSNENYLIRISFLYLRALVIFKEYEFVKFIK